MGIRGNEDADVAAKEGLDVAITNMRFPVDDLLACVNQLCVKEWQEMWNQCTSNKLYSVQLVVGRSVSEKCLKAINLLRVVAHTFWGADQQTLLHLYRSLIRSKLDYGCIVYGSARPSYLKILEPIHNHALRLCLGAFRTSPAVSLCVQATEPPLALRCKKLALQYCLKLSANTNDNRMNSSN